MLRDIGWPVLNAESLFKVLGGLFAGFFGMKNNGTGSDRVVSLISGKSRYNVDEDPGDHSGFIPFGHSKYKTLIF